jgi:hypothetical protein
LHHHRAREEGDGGAAALHGRDVHSDPDNGIVAGEDVVVVSGWLADLLP